MTLPRPRLPLRLLGLSLALPATHSLAEDSITLAPLQVSQVYSEGYQAREAAVGGFQPAPLLDTPASIAVFNEQLLADRQVRKLSEVLQSDASVGESYAPIGYYENFNVRGFELNAASSYKINGQTIAGEQNVALENKQQVELLKGLSGLQSGVSEPGGLINYVTKRPEDVRSVTVSSNEQGERYLATDLGGWFGSERQFGLRANLAHEDIRSYVDHADGKRDFASLAFDWQINPDAVLQLDAEYQQREQRSVPGYQLLGGNSLPHGIDPHDRLAYQHWANPVSIDSLNLGGRFEYRFSDNWTGSVSASRSKVVIDDYSSFAWGSSEGAYFSEAGDYDIYDYRSPDDTRRTDEAQVALNGRFDSLGVGHELTIVAALSVEPSISAPISTSGSAAATSINKRRRWSRLKKTLATAPADSTAANTEYSPATASVSMSTGRPCWAHAWCAWMKKPSAKMATQAATPATINCCPMPR